MKQNRNQIEITMNVRSSVALQCAAAQRQGLIFTGRTAARNSPPNFRRDKGLTAQEAARKIVALYGRNLSILAD